MKRLTVLTIFLLAFAVVNSNSQDDMKKWMEYMTPGDMHKLLAKNVGTWKATTTFWMSPGGEPTSSEATATSKMIMDGRYLVSEMKGVVMGMPFEGMAIDGYDNTAKVFLSTWIDNMGTGIMFMTGKWDETSKQVIYTGKMMDPMGGTYVDVRQVVTYVSDSQMKMEMYSPGPDGKEYKNMEVNYTKQ